MRDEVEVGVVPSLTHGPRDGPQAFSYTPALVVRQLSDPRSPPPGRHPDRAPARRDDREGPGVRVLPDQRLRRVHQRAHGAGVTAGLRRRATERVRRHEAQGHALPVRVRDRRAGPRAVVLEDAHGPGAAPRGQRVEAVARERNELARGGGREVGEALVVGPRRDEHFHITARREATCAGCKAAAEATSAAHVRKAATIDAKDHRWMWSAPSHNCG